MIPLLVLLFLGGVTLLAIEGFVLPGFGVAGFAGMMAMGGSLVLAASLGGQTLAMFFMATLLVVVLGYLLLRRFGPRTMGDIILNQRLDSSEGNVATGDLAQLLGTTGKTLTPLRPAGTVEIEGLRVDVVTQGEFVPAGEKVKVILVEGRRVVVERFHESE
ncbi:MAG: hypothetical protein GX062_00280 [Firmicutes bacterium]|nr:hypothetical protein [Bacillota bacterium]